MTDTNPSGETTAPALISNPAWVKLSKTVVAKNRHEHICESLELFASEVMGEFKAEVAAREARKAEMLAPYIEAAMKRKVWMQPLADDEIPIVRASVAKAQINQGAAG